VEGVVENFENNQQFFSHFALFNHTALSETQTGATVPLIMFEVFYTMMQTGEVIQ
jgi:hypothetical protein